MSKQNQIKALEQADGLLSSHWITLEIRLWFVLEHVMKGWETSIDLSEWLGIVCEIFGPPGEFLVPLISVQMLSKNCVSAKKCEDPVSGAEWLCHYCLHYDPGLNAGIGSVTASSLALIWFWDTCWSGSTSRDFGSHATMVTFYSLSGLADFLCWMSEYCSW